MNVARRVIISAILLASVVSAAAVYFGLILDGIVPPPDLTALARTAMPIARGPLATIVGLAILTAMSWSGAASTARRYRQSITSVAMGLASRLHFDLD